MQAERTKWKDEYNAGLSGGAFSVQDLGLRKDHLKRLDTDLNDQKRAELAQKRAVTKAERIEEAARVAFQEKANEVKVHEDRKERWLADLKKEELRREQKEIEEISTAMHERRRRQDRESE